jgi:predicted small integral membrane protein
MAITTNHNAEIRLLDDCTKELNTHIFIRILKKSGYYFLQWLCYILAAGSVAAIIFVYRIIGDFDTNIQPLQHQLDEKGADILVRTSAMADHYNMMFWGLLIMLVLAALVFLLTASSMSSARLRLDAVNDLNTRLTKVKTMLEARDFTG